MAIAWLVAASCVFYASWNPSFFVLLAGSVIVNFLVGRELTNRMGPQGKSSRALLVVGLLFNLGLLGYFKYANFFVDNLNAGLGTHLVLNQIILPIGISFFTFQEIAFLVDSYKGKTDRKRFLDFALFVSFFPQLIAGPIVHHNEMLSQFSKLGRESAYRRLSIGLTIFIIGLTKKLVIADSMEIHATALFDAVLLGQEPALIESWFGTLSYTLQIYFDFSGYSDMAIGLGAMFGIRLPVNFASPYRATSIADFWQRWHITLSRFLRDYLYIPLGGNRHGGTRLHFNLLATMVLGGIWHGAAWTFALWGGLHGLFLIIHRAWRGDPKSPSRRLPLPAARILTLLCVALAWVPFRATDIGSAMDVYRGLLGLNGLVLPDALNGIVGSVPALSDWVKLGQLNMDKPGSAFAWMIGAFLLTSLMPNTHQWMASHSPALPSPGYPATHTESEPVFSWQPRARYAIGLSVALLLCILKLNETSPFIYFQF